MSLLKPVIRTERFDIFHHVVERNPSLGVPKDVYEAWFHSEDVPRSVCEVTIWKSKSFGNYVEWCHVCEQYRRQGIATEVMRAIENHVGELAIN